MIESILICQQQERYTRGDVRGVSEIAVPSCDSIFKNIVETNKIFRFVFAEIERKFENL